MREEIIATYGSKTIAQEAGETSGDIAVDYSNARYGGLVKSGEHGMNEVEIIIVVCLG